MDRPLGDVIREYQAAVDDYDRELARPLDVNETDLRCLEYPTRMFGFDDNGERVERSAEHLRVGRNPR